MRCKDCGSLLISWELDSGKVITAYDDEGNQVSMHCEIDSITSPICESCGSTNLTD